MTFRTPTRSGERGAALVIALIATQLLLALGAALVLVASSEEMIAANYRTAADGLYAAEAALERAIGDLAEEPDWDAVLSGTKQSAFADGPPSGIRPLVDATTIDLLQVLNLANCQKKTMCRQADLDARTPDRPWGTTNPRWNLYAYGPLADGLDTQSAVQSPFYVVSMVADDPSEIDGDPARDGGTVDGTPSPGRGVLVVRADAFGPRGSHRIVEATVARRQTGAGELVPRSMRVLTWKEVHH